MNYEEINIVPPEDGNVFDIVAHVRSQPEPIRLVAEVVEIVGMEITDISRSFTLDATHSTCITTREKPAIGVNEPGGRVVNIGIETDDAPTFAVEQV